VKSLHRVVASAVVLASGIVLVSAPTTVRAADPVALTLVSQRLDVAAGAAIEIVVGVPDGTELPGGDSSIVVTAYDRLTSRAALRRAIGGTFSRAVDTLDFNLATTPRNDAGQLVISIPTEIDTRTPTALQLPNEGTYPVVVEIRSASDTVAELTTFVRRLAVPDSGSDDALASGDLRVAVAMSVRTPLRLDADLQTVADPEAVAELEQLTAIAAASPYPLTVDINPRHVQSLDNDRRAALAAALADDEVLAAPTVPLDPSIAMQDGQPDLATQWLRIGEDDLRTSLGVAASRSVKLIDSPLSKQGAALLRELGVRMFVMSRQQYEQLPDHIPDLDFPQLTGVRINDVTSVDMALPHLATSALLDEPLDTPARTAIIAAAELVVLRTELLSLGISPQRSGVVLARSDLGIPDPETTAAIIDLLSNTQGFQGVTLDEFSVRTDRLLFDGSELIAGLPDNVDGSIADRLATASTLTESSFQVSSMLPPDAPEVGGWLTATSLLASSAISDADVAVIAKQLTEQHETIREAVDVRVPTKFTLTGRDSELKLRLGNESSRPLTVLLKLESPKLDFPDGPQLFEIPPGGGEVTIRVTALTNGTLGLTLRVVTPYGSSELAPPLPLQATVNALSDLGRLATGSLIALVLLWWLQNWRSAVRKRAAAPSVQRHPVSAAGSQ
jgi:hypothetical protein